MSNRTAVGLVLLICGIAGFVYARSLSQGGDATTGSIVVGIGGILIAAIGIRLAVTKDPSSKSPPSPR
jgi:hypothetical protein